MSRSCFLTCSCSLVLLAMLGCGDIIPLWRGELSLNDYTLYYSDYPSEFEMDLSEVQGQEVHARLELVIRYYVGIGRSDLPLFIIIEDEENNISEFTTNVPLKSGDQWLGIPAENEIDYLITHDAIPSLKLKPSKYKLKIYANDDNEEKIYGVVRIEARLYELEEPAAP